MRRVLARSVIMNFGGQTGSLALGFIGSILLARWLGPSDRGLLAIMITVMTAVFSVAGMGLHAATAHFVARDRDRAGEILGNGLVFTAALTLVAIPIFWFFRDSIADLVARGEGGRAWGIVGLLISLTFLQWLLTNFLQGELRFGLANALAIGSRAIYLAAVAIFFALVTPSVGAALLATGIGALAFVLAALASVLRRHIAGFSASLLAQMLGFGSRRIVGELFHFINLRLDLVVLGLFRPLREVGIYAVAQLIAELVLVVAHSFRFSVLPLVSSQEGEAAQEDTTSNALRFHGLLALVALLANAVFGTLVILIGFGSDFHGAIVPMLILLPGMWFLGTGMVATADLAGRGRPGLGSLLAGASGLVTVALDVALIPSLGVPGAALASVLAYCLFGVGSLVAVSRVSGLALRELVVPTRGDWRRIRELARSASGRVPGLGQSS